ncbi:MAG TPA: DUF1800 domain-containing protein [Bryobacteraceae bacterium]|nr:DUF1800 domain-containing protein [Bryobacteraceae bacterium]
MKRFLLLMAAAAMAATCLSFLANAEGRFDKKLSPDQQILQALNRLTFGPRPGDIEQVRHVGVQKWIELQLHPDQIPENPELDARLKPLATLRMDLAAIVKEYTPEPLQPIVLPAMTLNQLLPPEDMRKVQIGTAEERTAVLKSLDPDKRRQVLAALPPNVLAHTPEFQKEGEDARKLQQEEMQKENRRRNPQLNDLLNPDQVNVARSGNKEQLTALFAYLDPEKRPLVAGLLPPQSLAVLPELRRAGMFRRTPRLVASDDLKQAKVFRALYSNRQLEEVLVDFWFNHFNVDQAKNVPQTQNLEHLLIGSYERDAIRPHVLGHFKDLLLATARHPAMLYYLDNWESMAPGGFEVGPFAPNRGVVNGVPNSIIPSPLARQAHGLNENYGREVMELHTLGVKGGYTQDDVIAVARCFTGWTVRDPANPEFVFASFMHDFGEKTVLGHKIAAGGGEQDGLQVIDILGHHPSTAKFISRELAQRFVADDPPQALVDRMARTFTKTDGDLRAVLETMFTSPEFFSEGAWQAKVKSPFEMVVSAVRAIGGEASDTYALVQKIADLGEPLYNKLEPTGYPNTGDAWLSTTGIMGRMNFSTALASGLVAGVKLDSTRLEGNDAPAIARDLLGRDASPQTQAALEKGLEGTDHTAPFIASLVLSSPDFQRR